MIFFLTIKTTQPAKNEAGGSMIYHTTYMLKLIFKSDVTQNRYFPFPESKSIKLNKSPI